MATIKILKYGVFTPVNSVIYGHEGDDILFDGIGNDTIFAHGGHDTITLGLGNDVVYAGAGHDIINDFGDGDDVMYGEDGNDWFVMGRGNDTANGGAGSDGVSYANSQKAVFVDLVGGYAAAEGTDTLVSIENASGSNGNDTLLGGDGDNYLYGADGDDRLDGRGGNDRILGGNGNDRIDGGAGNDVLSGDHGDDRLEGGSGDDVLWGGYGNDIMYGGTGADIFAFADGDISAYDTIVDFEKGRDKIDLRNIDARPDLPGRQAFTFDATPDGAAEEFFDGLSDDWGGFASNEPGPWINGDPGEIEYRYEGGWTYVYLSYGDGLTDASIRILGEVKLSASDFYL